MKRLINLGLLLSGISASTVSAGAVAPSATQSQLVKEMALQDFFHLTQPLNVKIYQPAGNGAEMGNQPARVCFEGPAKQQASMAKLDCTSLFGVAGQSDKRPMPMQTLSSAELQVLPGADGEPVRPSLVVQATYFGGGSGTIKGYYIWTADKVSGGLRQTFHSSVTGAGDQRVVKSGALAGDFVAVDQVYEGNEASMQSPVRYQMTVYEPSPSGYVQVLSFLSEQRYPSNHTGDGLPDAIATLTPTIERALNAVYPRNVAALSR